MVEQQISLAGIFWLSSPFHNVIKQPFLLTVFYCTVKDTINRNGLFVFITGNASINYLKPHFLRDYCRSTQSII